MQAISGAGLASLLHPLVLRETSRPHTETSAKSQSTRVVNPGVDLSSRVVPFTIGAPSAKLRLVASHPEDTHFGTSSFR
jgi:hypothetical protein